ncbi:MAG: hypothetical protein M1826_003841 [Phylliscum demangeonii]|nr:MAG: hypothetical protein M1826_003841 [Phylliscum demangeonii]
MEFEVAYTLDNAQQFWEELDEIVGAPCQVPAHIDQVLRLYLRFTSNYREEYLDSEDDLARCSCRLLDAEVFKKNASYVRHQIVHSLIQEDAANLLHVITSILYIDGRQHESTLELLSREGAFPRLVHLIRREGDDDDGLLHRRLLELLYEMSRIQRIRLEDLSLVDDAFVVYLFKIIEELSDDVNDPYHYPVIRVLVGVPMLLVLNEQYMVCAHEPGLIARGGAPLTNRVIKVLSLDGSAYKTFGENLILVLNRENETSLQLLILKLLYLLCTTRATYEYFYTNDLRVLVDVMIRNLLDLTTEADALRHTYLRVLYPLLAHTQLRHPPHYKRDDILRLLDIFSASSASGSASSARLTGAHHFSPLDDTTVRLARRCLQVAWLSELLAHNRFLGISLAHAGDSTLSMAEMAETTEKPGVVAPSRTQGDARCDARCDDESGGGGGGGGGGNGVPLVKGGDDPTDANGGTGSGSDVKGPTFVIGEG